MTKRVWPSFTTGITAGALVLVFALATVAQQSTAPPKKAGASHDAAYYAFRDTVDQINDQDRSLPRFRSRIPSAQAP